MAKRYLCSIKFIDCFLSFKLLPSIGSRRESTKGAMLLKIHKLFCRSPLSSSQRNKAKRASSFEVLRKIFIIPPHLYKGIQRAFEQSKRTQFTNCLRLTPYYICRFTERLSKYNYKQSLTFYGTSQG